MNSPSFRTENTDKPRIRGRQAKKTENSVGQRIEAALGARTRFWLAQATGLPDSTIGDAISRGPAKTEVALKLARALDVSLDWLLVDSYHGREKVDGVSATAVLSPDQLDAISGNIAGLKKPVGGADLDLVALQEIDLAYGMGGTYANDPVEVQTLHFPRAWVEAITSTVASQLTIARGRGDSMQPTIQDGDMVMIDRSQRTIREQDAIWALTIGDFAMIKRIRAGGERVRILSDNDRVPPDDVFHEEINIVGRVIFIGRKI